MIRSHISRDLNIYPRSHSLPIPDRKMQMFYPHLGSSLRLPNEVKLINRYDVKFRQIHITKYSSKADKPSVIELIKRFPKASLDLLDSYRTYKNILDASTTPLNAWTKIGHIPRRQAEQSRKFKRDFKKVLFPVLFAAIPIVGNSIFIPIAMNPNLFLSSHFLIGYEVSLAQREYSIRSEAYDSCLNELKKTLGLPLNINQEDLLNHFRSYSHIAWKTMHRKHIDLLAHASGIPVWIIRVFPSFVLSRKLNGISGDILEDNIDLILEEHHRDSCQRLTDDEVLHACCLRGLKLDGIINMRSTLCVYLLRMQGLMLRYGEQKQEKMNDEWSESLKIMTLHLSFISIS